MNATNPSNHNDAVTFEDEDIFDDSTFLAKFQETSFQETTTRNSKSFDRSALNVSALCCDEEISGYDKLTGRTWIYPTNYSVRDYQFNIIRAALVKNTLVSLPTGLGKTFIAAVIMYNFYRWYPLGKIVFTAPTRPLVAQQIDACYNIVAIPPDDTIEMTGNMNANSRKLHWKSKRVFFATPQVIQNDLLTGICPADKIRCLVFDEAHRARGNYAYCHIIGSLTDKGCKTFRVLALSATPGSKVEDVSNVVRNLHIAHLELRTENCIDVSPYSHSRKINTVIVQLGPALSQLRNQYVEILDGYARRLKQLNILPHNLGNLSKGRIVMLYKEYQTKDRGSRHPQHNYIMKDFTLLIALYHGLELLVKHGSRVFLNFFDEHPEKSWIQADDRLTALLERLRDDLGVNPLALDRSILPDGTIPEIPKDLTFGHPKFDKLREIMLDHFKKAKDKEQDTRAIVFCEYRESVNLVHCLLLQCRPLITPQMFVGQGASGKDGKTVVSQKQQLRIMSNFRSGASNTLVATCVAEEGLDVGSVDLIICFDISTRSPVRLVQRCGRTGRERGGQVHILVTEGREHQTLMDCMRQRDGLNKKILQSKDVENNLYKQNPRMMPHDHTPTCQKMYITVAKKPDPKDRSKSSAAKGKKAQKDIITMLNGRASASNKNCSGTANKDVPDANVFITKEEFDEMYPEGLKAQIIENDVKEYWALNRDSLLKMAKIDERVTNHSAWLEWQRTLQKTVNFTHTKDTEILSELLQYSDAKRFELPISTQNPTFNTQNIATQNIEKSSPVKPKINKPKKQKPVPEVHGRKDGDIRALFSTATKSTKNYTKLINDLGIPDDGSLPTSLIDLLVDMSLENTSETVKCYLCLHFGDCKLLQTIRRPKKEAAKVSTFLKNPNFPDINLLDDIDADTIEKCVAKPIEEDSQLFDDHIEIFPDNKENCSRNFELEFDFDSPDNIEAGAELPSENSEKNFDIGNIEDIFAESSPEEGIEKILAQTLDKPLKHGKDVKIDDKNSSNPKDALGFFGLESIDDIFADSDDSLDTINRKETATVVAKEEIDNMKPLMQLENKTKCSEKPILNHKPLIDPVSPSLLSGSHKKPSPTSPILCSQVRKFRLSTNKSDHHSSTPIIKPKQLFKAPEATEIEDNNNKMKSTANNLSTTKDSSIANTSNKSMFTITQLVEMINKTDGTNSKLGQSLNKEEEMFLTQIKKDEDERSNSPILFTQREKKKVGVKANKHKSLKIRNNDSLIILDSDSDSDTCMNDITQVYDVENALNSQAVNEPKDALIRSPLSNKRKLDFDNDCNNASPYFSKRLKLVSPPLKAPSLQEKIIAALSSQKPTDKDNNKNNDSGVNYVITSPIDSQKENLSPVKYKNGYKNKLYQESKSTNRLKKLQLFRHDAKISFSMKSQGKEVTNNKDKSNDSKKRKITFDDSDDEFIFDEKKFPSPKIKKLREESNSSIVNHKIRKKKKAKNEFLDLEAAISSESGSGDELSDDSAGSIVHFICDDDVTVREDMHALYINSVKSPVKGMFKIPELPKKYNDAEIFSQCAEQDADYEMDSFCVDSHIGLTQINDVSELELAEQILERKRKVRRKDDPSTVDLSDGDSPVVKRKNKNVKRRISSDSDDSS